MSKRSQEKRRARSKEKKLAQRRLMGASPLSRLAGTAEETCECWMNCSPDERMVSFQVMRPVRGGQMVGAFFLIDRDCVGLKDAFYRLNIEPAEVRESLRRRSEHWDTRVVRMELSAVRKAVAEAIRWTRAHPFRMPPDTERCVTILGGVDDIDTADISAFGDENGDMFYLGRQVDLVRCLRGITLEEFLEREDVECVFHNGNETFGDGEVYDEEWDEVDGDSLMDLAEFDDAEENREGLLALRDQIKHNIIDGSRRWCFSQALMSHPELEAAVELTLAATMGSFGEVDEADAALIAMQAKATLQSFDTPERQAVLAAAMAQVEGFMKTFPSKEAFASAMGFPDPDA
jgi:hypothetical protein